jgi:Tfp pilus assembly protein PilF
LALDPDYGDARINLASIHEREGKLEEARAQLRRAAGDPRAAARAWTALGGLELRQGSPGQAVSALETVRLGSVSADVYEALGDAHLAAGHPEQAHRAWRHALALDPGRPHLREKLKTAQVRTKSRRYRPTHP